VFCEQQGKGGCNEFAAGEEKNGKMGVGNSRTGSRYTDKEKCVFKHGVKYSKKPSGAALTKIRATSRESCTKIRVSCRVQRRDVYTARLEEGDIGKSYHWVNQEGGNNTDSKQTQVKKKKGHSPNKDEEK